MTARGQTSVEGFVPEHLLSIFDWSSSELLRVFARAQRLKTIRRLNGRRSSLAGKTVALIFEKESTRTRVSFEAGVANLGGSTVVLQARDTQLRRGEPVKDAARVLGRYVDAIVMRTFAQATLEEMARHAGVPVINGLTDLSHPCQVLADVFTVLERRQEWRTLHYAYVGDGNNMANSFIAASAVLGFPLALACPDGFRPDDGYLTRAGQMNARVSVHRDPVNAVCGADVVITDVWTSMGQEGEAERRRTVFAPYQVNAELMAQAKPDALLLHCLPAHRGEEITEDVLEGPQSVVFDEAENRLPVQQAVLETVMKVGE
jgi:ornithine carbamoyltransferase